MLKQRIFDDYMEQQAIDHTALQQFVANTFNRLAGDVVTKTRRYAGFTTVKTGQVEVQAQPGRFYDGPTGVMFAKDTATTQSMLQYLAASTKRIVVLSVSGATVETEQGTRDYVINVDTMQTEPRNRSLVLSNDAVLSFTAGAESGDPQAPSIPSTHVAIAHILLDTTQVVSVTMLGGNDVTSTEELDLRALLLEEFRRMIEPRVNSLAADLADLANRLSQMGRGNALHEIKLDLARVKEALRFPDDAVGYGADFFLFNEDSDHTNSAALGYDALVMEGVRFPDANADEFELDIFSQNDPNATLIDGVLLPRFQHELKLSAGAYHSDLGIAQYGFQTHTMKQGYMSRSRVRYGGTLYECTNGTNYNFPGEEPDAANLYDFETWVDVRQAIDWIDPNGSGMTRTRTDWMWYDSWKEPFMYAEVTEHVISGAQIAQSFLVSNDFWATKLRFYCTQKAANENIIVSLVEVTNGVPDPEKTIQHLMYPHASIVTGWNDVPITPSFLAKGKRYALVITSNANHKFGLTEGQSYLDGTLFYSTDGSYFLGDLTKDLMFEVYGAKFDAAQVTIEFEALNLDGGIRMIDILGHMWIPGATQLVFEVRPSGSGEWMPLTADNAGVLAAAPALMQFRARFIGTRDMQPAIKLTGSRVKISRPKTAFRHVSALKTVPATTAITVIAVLEGYDETPHDLTCRLRIGGAYENPDTTVATELDPSRKRIKKTFTFSPASTTQFLIEFNGATNSPQNTYHIAERLYYTE